MILWLFFCLFVRSRVVAALGSELFLEQPQNITVEESETAVFRCSVINSTFSLVWLVNCSDACYTVFQERGVVIVPDHNDYTRSQLHVAGHLYNNNTKVHCAALTDEPPLTWTNSEIVLLIVREVTKPVVGSVFTSGTSSSLASRHTETYTTQHLYQSSKTGKNMYPTPQPPSWTTPHSSTILIEIKETEQDIILLFVITVPIMVSFMFVVGFTLLILLIFRKHRKVECPENKENIELDSNPVYELTKPIKLQQNKLYTYTVPEKTVIQ